MSAQARRIQEPVARTGVLVITASAQGSGTMRLRVVSTTDIVSGAEQRFHFTDAEEALEYVRQWLADLGDADVTGRRQRPVSVVRQDPPTPGGDRGAKGG